MKTVTLPLDKLIAYAGNPRKNDHAVEAVASAIKRFGFRVPVLAKSDGSLIDGHLRVKAAKHLGMEEVPAVLCDDLSEADIKALRISINRMAELADWDTELLRAELEGLAAEGITLEDVGFNADYLEELGADLGLLQGNPEADAEPQIDKAEELRAKWGVEPGQLWELGEHRLLCGDSTKKEDVERVMGGKKLQAVVTDPPYGMEFQSNHRKIKHEAISGDGDEDLLMLAIGLEASHSKYIWCRWDNIPKLPKPKSVITWAKNNWSMGDLEHEHARQTEVCLFYAGPQHRWVGNRPTDLVSHARTGNDLHPTQKPVSLIAEVIGWTAGDIYEPFSGSGTTIIACEQLGRKCRAIEISPAYVAVALQRWADATGKTPKLVA
jgi:DNA modification methylase